jgi:transposase
MTHCNTIAIDLAKNVFQVCVLNDNGTVAFNKKVSRAKLAETIANIDASTVVMGACYSSHYWGRKFQDMGYKVKLIPAQHVTPFVRGNKNDHNDALAIAEASRRPGMRPVSVKTLEQQDIQVYHRLRTRHVEQRTAIANQLRGLMSEYGVVVSKGIRTLMTQLPGILEDAENGLTSVARGAFFDMLEEIKRLTEMIKEDDRQIQSLSSASEQYPRLLTAPGIGALTASAILNKWGNKWGQSKIIYQHNKWGQSKIIYQQIDLSLKINIIHSIIPFISQHYHAISI